MNAHPHAPRAARDASAAAAPFPPRAHAHALFRAKHPPLPSSPMPPMPTMPPPPPPPPPPPQQQQRTAVAAVAPSPHDKLPAPYVHRPVVSHASYLYPLHHQMMTPVAHVPIGAAHYAHLPPSIWPSPHQYAPQHMAHHPVVAHMQPSYSLQHPAPVAYAYAPLHTAPLPSVKPPPPQDHYSHQSIPYHLHQHHVVHQSTLPASHPLPHQHPNVSPPQSAPMPHQLTPAPMPPPPAPSHPPEPRNAAAPPEPNAPNRPTPATSPPPNQNSTKHNSPASKPANSATPTRKPRKPYTMTKARELWSQQEHARFVQALKLYDRDWKKIEAYIGTKTVLQIRSHAQKHFGKVTKYKTGEYIPPPRPKKRAALPYPRTRNANGSKLLAPSSGTASDSGNGSENGTANGSATNGNSSEGFRPLPNGTLPHAEPIKPHQHALNPLPPIPNSQKWAPNGHIAPGNPNHPNGTSRTFKAMPTDKSRNGQGTARIHNLLGPQQPSSSSAPAPRSRTPNTFNAREGQPSPAPLLSASYEPRGRFNVSNDGRRLPNGVGAADGASGMSNPNSSLHVLSNCVDMMTKEALPPRQPAAGWASAAAARRAHRAKVVRSRKSSRPSSPARDKDAPSKMEVQNGKRGTVAVNGMLRRPPASSSPNSGRKNGIVQKELSTTANNVVQKRGRSPPIVQTDEERKQVGPPDSQRSSANSSNGKNDVNDEFTENGRPSASETGNGLSSGGSGTGISPENSDSGLAEDDPRSSNDGSGYDGNRPSLSNRDCSPAEPISSNSSRNSPKRGSSITHLLSDPSTTVVANGRSSEPARMEVVRQVSQKCAVELEMSNGDMLNSRRCAEVKSENVQKGTTLRDSQPEHQSIVASHQSMYIDAEKKEGTGIGPGKQAHKYHANRVLLHVDHELSQRQRKGLVNCDGAPDVGTKRLRNPPTAERTGSNEVEDGYGRDRKAQRVRQMSESQSLKAEY